MKTLIVTGVVWQDSGNKKLNHYNLTLFGQTRECPEVEYIKSTFLHSEIGYSDVIKRCKEIYCEYFDVDKFDIITLENIIRSREGANFKHYTRG